jgi:hypothetical protein
VKPVMRAVFHMHRKVYNSRVAIFTDAVVGIGRCV